MKCVGFAVFLASLAVSACGCGNRVDAKYATPQATIQTLLHAYALDTVPESEVHRRMAARQRFQLVDGKSYEGCFTSFRGVESEALGGFVVGALAAGKDHLTFGAPASGRVTVKPSQNATIVLRETGEGWKISLEESVPREVRMQLREVTKRAQERARAQGVQ